MSLGTPEMFGIALMALWGTAGAVAFGRSVAKSPAARELAEAVRKMNLASKCALVAGLVGVVAIGGTKPGNGTNNPPNRLLSSLRTLPAGASDANAHPFALVEVRTNGVALAAASTNAVVSESVRRRGTSEGGEWIETEKPFFRWGTNPVSRVFASPATLSFGTMRHTGLGAALPDGTSAESLVALRTPLGLAPEANWLQLSSPSRFWHKETTDGRVFTWENALLDRQTDQPATVQIETRNDGEFVFRYDFTAAVPTNDFLVGAQLGPSAVEALSVHGGVMNAATVYRVNGAPVPAGVSVADFFDALRFELRWKNIADLGDLSGDTDGDGLSDGDEILLYGTDPRQADTDGDGLSDSVEILAGADPFDADEDNDSVPDGADPVAWAANPLWAGNATNVSTSITITLNTTIPDGAFASLLVDGLCIPLRSSGSWTLALEPGELYTYRLHTYGAPADLSISPATNAPSLRSVPPLRSAPAPFPFWIDDPDGVFDGPSNGGEGEMAVPMLELTWIDPGDGSHSSNFGICLHNRTEARFTWRILPAVLTGRIGNLVLENLCLDHQDFVLAVSETASVVEGIASLPEGSLRFGHLCSVVCAHLCDSDYWNPGCFVCGFHQFLYEGWHNIDYLMVIPDGLASGQDIVEFPGNQVRTFNAASSPTPDLHQPFFYEDARARFLTGGFLSDYVYATGFMTPEDEPPAGTSFEWRCEEGLSESFPEFASGTWASFLIPMQGGVYRFRFRCGASLLGDAILVLPLAGASVDSIVSTAIAKADQFATKVNDRYLLVERNLPVNGLKWFWSEGAGDFLGRPDNASSKTVWFYNQVNDENGMGAVCTWGGHCVRLAKLSNFLCGYACRKIGVNQLLQEFAQLSGTANDTTAYSSWGCGEALACGTMTLDGCAARIGQLSWESGDQKIRKLWPNDAPADNFVVPNLFFNPNTQFTAPGFLYMEDP